MTEIREEEPVMRRESDRLIVPMKAGNAAGGKEATHGRAMQGDTRRAQNRRPGDNGTGSHRQQPKASEEPDA